MTESEDLQFYLNKKTTYDVRKKGGENFLHAKYLNLVSNEYNSSKQRQKFLISIRKHKEFEEIKWDKAFKICLAVLKRYKMILTLNTIQSEFGKLPEKTGYKNSKQLEKYMHEILYEREPITPKDYHSHRKHPSTESSKDIRTKPNMKESKAKTPSRIIIKEEVISKESPETTYTPMKTVDATIIDETYTTDTINVHVGYELLPDSGSASSQNTSNSPPVKIEAKPGRKKVSPFSTPKKGAEDIIDDINEDKITKNSESSKKKRKKVRVKKHTPKKKEAQNQNIEENIPLTLDSGDMSSNNDDILPFMYQTGKDADMRKSRDVLFGTIESLTLDNIQSDENYYTFDALQNFIDDGEPSLSIDTGDGSPIFRNFSHFSRT